MRRLKRSEVAKVRDQLMIKQGQKCPLCERSFKGRGAVKPALDHDHVTGKIRQVLCLNCNGMEGKVFNLARRALKGYPDVWIQRLSKYWATPALPLLHPTHKTDAEKRERTNRLARERRAKLKGQT